MPLRALLWEAHRLVAGCSPGASPPAQASRPEVAEGTGATGPEPRPLSPDPDPRDPGSRLPPGRRETAAGRRRAGTLGMRPPPRRGPGLRDVISGVAGRGLLGVGGVAGAAGCAGEVEPGTWCPASPRSPAAGAAGNPPGARPGAPWPPLHTRASGGASERVEREMALPRDRRGTAATWRCPSRTATAGPGWRPRRCGAPRWRVVASCRRGPGNRHVSVRRRGGDSPGLAESSPARTGAPRAPAAPAPAASSEDRSPAPPSGGARRPAAARDSTGGEAAGSAPRVVPAPLHTGLSGSLLLFLSLRRRGQTV